MILLNLVIIVLIWSVIQPKSYLSWAAEVIPAIVVIIILIATYGKYQFSTLAYSIVAFLSILAFIGGHYTFAEVPFFNQIKDYFHLQRNHYDRLCHLLTGLAAIVIREIFIVIPVIQRGFWINIVSFCSLVTISASYEIVEWLSTKTPIQHRVAKDFLGMQGDKWDAQWDMSLALIGAALALLTLSTFHDTLLEKKLLKLK